MIIAVVLLIAAGALGGAAGFFSGYDHGFEDALRAYDEELERMIRN